MIVTTSQAPSEQLLAQAKRLCTELEAKWVDRRQMTVSFMLKGSKDGKLFVVTEGENRLYDIFSERSEQPLIYHPSMAFVKLKRMLKGEAEPLISISECAEGDFVLDCTAGLCSDALLFSMAVGSNGRVLALESERLLYTIVREGLASYETSITEIKEAMRRIEMKCEAHDQYLKAQPDKSIDIVYFDPMFRRPVHESSAIKAIRSVANAAALQLATIDEAKRVARKCVILKEHSKSEEFERLGFTRCTSERSNKIAYGIIKL